MLSVLKKVTSKVLCIVKEREFEFRNGIEAYESMEGNYMIKSIDIKNGYIVFELKEVNESKDWQEDYKRQFGEEPSFF